jgi:hypothetical protein
MIVALDRLPTCLAARVLASVPALAQPFPRRERG